MIWKTSGAEYDASEAEYDASGAEYDALWQDLTPGVISRHSLIFPCSFLLLSDYVYNLPKTREKNNVRRHFLPPIPKFCRRGKRQKKRKSKKIKNVLQTKTLPKVEAGFDALTPF